MFTLLHCLHFVHMFTLLPPLTLFTPSKLLYTAQTLASIPIYIVVMITALLEYWLYGHLSKILGDGADGWVIP